MAATCVAPTSASFESAAAKTAPVSSITSEAECISIFTELAEAFPKLTPESTAEFLSTLLFSFADNGTSPQTNYNGSFTTGEGADAETIPLQDFVALILKHTSTRRFARLYAKHFFNASIRLNRPPANWAKKGFTNTTKFSAFDFFDGVTSPAALEPEGGLIRDPTPEELILANANSQVLIARGQKSATTSTLPEVAGGRLSTDASIQIASVC